ncbi:MAG: hypothetical protein WCD18_05695, partial [Thermosynechococcaceae cyanobacterium]
MSHCPTKDLDSRQDPAFFDGVLVVMAMVQLSSLDLGQLSMGAIRVPVVLTNAVDEELVRRGLLSSEQVRVCRTEALVDTGA